jgi:hypothetical protein
MVQLKLLLLLGSITTVIARSHRIVARNTIAIIPSASPTQSVLPTATPDQRRHSKHVNDFYKLYGWLKPNTSVPDKELPKAIRKIQKVLEEPVTGVFSDRMMDIMTKPRCGTEQVYNETAAKSPPDLHKRYVVWGSKWPKTTITWRFVSYSADLSAAQQQSTLRCVLGTCRLLTFISWNKVYPRLDWQSTWESCQLFEWLLT